MRRPVALLPVLAVLAVIVLLAGGCSSGAGPAATPADRGARGTGSTAGPSTATSTPSASTTATSTPTTATSTPGTPAAGSGLGADRVLTAVEEAEDLLDRTPFDESELPPELADGIDEVLRSLVAGDITDQEFFAELDRLVPIGLLGEAYLICDVDALGAYCTTTEADYLDWAGACRTVDGALVERLVAEAGGWAATGFCLWDDEPELIALARPPALA